MKVKVRETLEAAEIRTGPPAALSLSGLALGYRLYNFHDSVQQSERPNSRGITSMNENLGADIVSSTTLSRDKQMSMSTSVYLTWQPAACMHASHSLRCVKKALSNPSPRHLIS